jgi:ATP-dependent DNA helicase RecG
MPKSVKRSSLGEKTPDRYRNPWLAKAMVNLSMIDTMGYGIHTMYKEQRKRFFPLPDYSKTKADKVVLEIYGQVLDINYSKLLLEKTDLSLSTVIMLDRIQKKMKLEPAAYEMLKKERLIEGRKPNYFISAVIAKVTGQQTDYFKKKGIDDEYCRKMILDYLGQFGSATRAQLEEVLLNKLPGILTERQRKDKVKNNLQALKTKELIKLNKERKWVLV